MKYFATDLTAQPIQSHNLHRAGSLSQPTDVISVPCLIKPLASYWAL